MRNMCKQHWAMLCLFLAAVCCSWPSLAQVRINVTGTVVDSTGTIPLPGVTVKVDGAATGSQTDAKGKFSLNASPDAILVFTYIGYNRKVVAVGGRTNLYVPLSATNEKLNEVVVVGYGQQKKVSVTGAVAAVGPKELKQSSSANIANALAGRLPGLTSIQSAGGQPGRDDATMYLRGAGTVNGKSPLILIDDVPRDNLRTIDPNEVASISILKDASATAVYGVRGANGVILITTRRGQPGRAELNVTADQSFSAFTREPERLHSLEYMALRNEASANDNMPLPFPKEIMDKYANPLAGLDPKDPDYAQKAKVREYMYPDHDYYREFAKRFAPQTRVNMNLSGGTDKVSYFANAGFLHQGGNIKTESPSQLGYNPTFKMDRYSFRTNLDYRITSSLKAFLNIGSYIEKVNMPSAGTYPGSSTDWMMSDIIYQAQTILPITPGPTTIAGFGVPEGKVVDPGYLDRSAFEVINRQGYRKEVRSNLNSTLGLQWDLSSLVTRGLSLKGMISYDSRATTAMQGYKTEQLYTALINYATDELSYTLKRANDGRISLVKGADSRYNINMQGSILYNRTFGGKHAVGGLILAQRDYWETTGGDIPFNVIGLSGRATYAYDNRYLVEFNFGYNGSEQFAPTKRFGFFPAVSAGWVASNEAFLKGNNVITNLKLRASYGKVGNDKLGTSDRFLYLSDITVGGGPLPSLGGGINQGLLANPRITWETAKKQNYGIDLELFGDLGITFDYFLENRSDILYSRGTVPQLQGVPLNNIPKLNLGVVDNKGFEIELNYHKNITKDFQVMFKGNFGYNHNVVKFLDEPINSDKYAYRYRNTGYSIGQSWGYKIDYSNGNGYFNSKEELDKFLSHTTYGFGTPRVGDFIYKDLNGDGVIDDKDLAPIKYSSIPGIIYGAGLNLGYKAFEFSIFFQGVGQYSSNYANQGVYENIKQGTYFDYHEHAWTAERYAKGEKITYPALSTGTTTNHQANDFFIMDRSFVRLKNLELAYNIPPSLLKQAAIKGIRVYVGGQNLFTWDKLKMGHLDPETNNSIGYTVTKMFSFGLNATF
ncbi:TonB-dependent receptor [Chitinophaga sp. 212800010-3]|uniref:SusC/RagA family TonB-linked outer membrane protein n=1 Tax=unclassified Chitinophaga TaxID=2619133 RepID=UPI002DEF1DD0|nr:TonB-dependent receptor [Chitinophaga sp. 212800010-3]